LGGIKTVPGSWTRAGSLIGSPPDMAPGLWDGHEIDGRPHQYPLAVMADACPPGRPPFHHRAPPAPPPAHPPPAIPPPRPGPPHAPGLPTAVDTVLARGAAKRREDRYPDVLAFAAALRAASGLADDEEVPRLPPAALVTTATLPAPIADAVALVGGARSTRAA